MIQHVALEVAPAQTGACVAFWALLGFEEVEPPAGLAARSRWVQRGEQQVHLLFADAPVVAPEGHVAVLCPAYEETLGALLRAGFEADPRTAYWGSPRCFVRCPAGHRVELMASAPQTGAP